MSFDAVSNPPEPLCEEYSVKISGRPVAVYRARVSAVPYNRVWPGYQRSLDQTEIAGFVSWDMTEPVEVTVVVRRPIETVSIRPSSAGLTSEVNGDTIRFTVPRPGQFSIEINGLHQALHCFANPVSAGAPSADESNVLYFGPGVHHPGIIRPTNGQHIHLADGAIVHGSIQAKEVHGLRITGRGILDASTFDRFEAGGCICLLGCSDCVIEGIILRDSDVWTVILVNCHHLEVANIKLIGLWRYNADGIDVVNSQNVHIHDTFVRAFDDCIVMKGMTGWVDYPAGILPVEDILVERCVLWNDWGRALEVGAETCAPAMRRIVFRDCDVLHTTHVVMDIQHGDRAIIEQILFENISVELTGEMAPPEFQNEVGASFTHKENSGHLPHLMGLYVVKNLYSADEESGRIMDVIFRNIQVTAPAMPESAFYAQDAEHEISGVTIENLSLNGTVISRMADLRLQWNAHVSDVRLLPLLAVID